MKRCYGYTFIFRSRHEGADPSYIPRPRASETLRLQSSTQSLLVVLRLKRTSDRPSTGTVVVVPSPTKYRPPVLFPRGPLIFHRFSVTSPLPSSFTGVFRQMLRTRVRVDTCSPRLEPLGSFQRVRLVTHRVCVPPGLLGTFPTSLSRLRPSLPSVLRPPPT